MRKAPVHLLQPLQIHYNMHWSLSACAYVNYVQRRDMSHMHTIVFIWTVARSNKNNRKARALTFLAFNASSLLNVLGTDIYTSLNVIACTYVARHSRIMAAISGRGVHDAMHWRAQQTNARREYKLTICLYEICLYLYGYVDKNRRMWLVPTIISTCKFEHVLR